MLGFNRYRPSSHIFEMKLFVAILKIIFIIITISFVLGLYSVHRNGSAYMLTTTWLSSECKNGSKKNFDFGIINNSLVQCKTVNSPKPSILHLAMVVCGERVWEALVSLKSAATLTKSTVHAHLYADEFSSSKLKEHLNQWPTEVRRRFNYTLYKIQYPPELDFGGWVKMFRPCATQRLFFPFIMKDVDSLVYLDTDTLLLTSLENVWKHFNDFNSTQISGLAPEAEKFSSSWYNDRARTPFVPPNGVNSGTMLMNLTRMRSVHWTNSTIHYYKRYASGIQLGDQDLINIFFHFNPDKLYLLPCSLNFRADHCRHASKTSKCQSALTDGASVLHGNDRSFHKEPTFIAVLKSFTQHIMWNQSENELLPRLKKNLQESSDNLCKEVSHVFTRQIETKLYCDTRDTKETILNKILRLF